MEGVRPGVRTRAGASCAVEGRAGGGETTSGLMNDGATLRAGRHKTEGGLVALGGGGEGRMTVVTVVVLTRRPSIEQREPGGGSVRPPQWECR